MVKVAVAPIHRSKHHNHHLLSSFCCSAAAAVPPATSAAELLMLQAMAERPTTVHAEEEGGGEDPTKQLRADDEDADDDAAERNAGCRRKLQTSPSAAAEEMELAAGSIIAIDGPPPDRPETPPAAPPIAGLDSCNAAAGGEDELNLPATALVSYSTAQIISDGVEASVAGAAHAGEDKKLQYTLRSNPKRSRRFLDPDYTLELAAPASSSSPAAAGPLPLLSGAAPAPAIAPSSAAPAPPNIKKGNSLFSEKARACTECGKQFPSWKALFGHMRCHPERQWRGIQPPTSFNAANLQRDRPTTSISIADHSTIQQTTRDTEECTSTHSLAAGTKQLHLSPRPAPTFWDQSDSENAIKGRITRPRARSCSDYDVEESDTESIEAAYMNGRHQHHRRQNIQLNARGRHSKRSLQDVVSGGSDGGHYLESNTPPDEVMEDRDMADCLVMLAFAAKSKADESDGDSALLDWKNHVRQSPLMSLREARKSMGAKDMRRSSNGRVQKSIPFLQEAGEGNMFERWGEEVDQDKGTSLERGASRSKFECSTCKKTFRSHQALGGHRASHKKVKGCFARTNAAEEATMANYIVPDAATAEEMNATALTMATTLIADQDPHQRQQQNLHQEEDQEVFDTAAAADVAKQKTEDLELDEQQGPFPAPPLEEMSMGQFLQFSITCSEKMEEDQNFESAEKLHLKHQTSSCSSSSSIIAAAGTLVLHHHHHPLQQAAAQQPKIHQCSICRRVFSTGQALGGHKRCHWGGSGMPPEAGKKCPLMRQDSDGGGTANCMIGMTSSASERSSELSRKGMQESGSSFATAEAPWMNLSSSLAMTEKEFCAHMYSGVLSKKNRQDSVASCEEVMKAGLPSVHSWLGAGYVPACEKEKMDLINTRVMMGARVPAACKEQSEGATAQRGWLEAISGNTKLGDDKSQLQQYIHVAVAEVGGSKRQELAATARPCELDVADQGAAAGEGSAEETVLYKACAEYMSRSSGIENEGIGIPLALPSSKVDQESMLDLNLPAPADEEEEQQQQLSCRK